MDWLKRDSWSPYVGGAIIGLLSWIAFLAVAPLGASTSYVRTSGMIENLFSSTVSFSIKHTTPLLCINWVA